MTPLFKVSVFWKPQKRQSHNIYPQNASYGISRKEQCWDPARTCRNICSQLRSWKDVLI